MIGIKNDAAVLLQNTNNLKWNFAVAFLIAIKNDAAVLLQNTNNLKWNFAAVFLIAIENDAVLGSLLAKYKQLKVEFNPF